MHCLVPCACNQGRFWVPKQCYTGLCVRTVKNGIAFSEGRKLLATGSHLLLNRPVVKEQSAKTMSVPSWLKKKY